MIEKIYGREARLEVLQALQDTRACQWALPVVFMRLKQKEGEWKRAQRKWNKIRRAVDTADYAHSLDHQGITFKTAGMKALSTKAFVPDRGDHGDAGGARAHAVLLSCPLFMRGCAPSINLGTKIENADVFRDAVKLGVSYSLPVHLGGTQLCLDAGWKSWIEVRLFRALFQFDDWDEWPSTSSASQSGRSLGFLELEDSLRPSAPRRYWHWWRRDYLLPSV